MSLLLTPNPNPYTKWRGGNDAFTKLLLSFDGSDGSTTITDRAVGSTGSKTFTAAGNAQIDTAQSKFGGASLLCDGSGDYVTVADHADWTLGAGDWTIDTWFNWAGGSGTRGIIAAQCNSAGPSASSTSFLLDHSTANTMRCFIANGSSFFELKSTTTITTTGWHHLAFVSESGTLKLYLDGVKEDELAGATPNNSTNNLSIGRGGEVTTLTWNGWIDEFRISVGIARWTANFTPPARAYW